MAPKLQEETEVNLKMEAAALKSYTVAKQKILDIESDLKDFIGPTATETVDPILAREYLSDADEAYQMFCEQDSLLRELYTTSSIESIRKEHRDVRSRYLAIKQVCYPACKIFRDEKDRKELEMRIALEKARIGANNAEQEGGTDTTPSIRPMKLPELKLPIFAGDYREWNTFKDLFEAGVKCQKIADVQKMHLLVTHLDGVAKRTISGIPVCEQGFEQAWTALEKTFGNDRELLRSYVEDIMDFKGPVADTGDSPRQLRDAIRTFVFNGCRLVGLNVDAFPWEAFFVTLMEKKLSPEARLRWDEEIQRKMKEIGSGADITSVTMTHFIEFLGKRGDIGDPRSQSAPQGKKQDGSKSSHGRSQPPKNGSHPKGTHQVNHTSAEQPKKSCICCKKEGHLVNTCHKFKQLNYEDRRKVIAEGNVCFKCFKPGHRSKVCRGNVTCATCQGKHNSLLHFEKDEDTSGSGSQSKEDPTVNFTRTSSSTTIFTTALVEIKDQQGNWISCRALFDDGASPNCISQQCVKKLGLPTYEDGSRIRTMTAPGGRPVQGCVKLQIRSRVHKDYVLKDQALIVDYDFSRMPSRPVSTSSLGFISGLKLADPQFNVPGPIDILICNRVYMASLDKLAHLGNGSIGPIARSSRFGWFVTGAVPEGSHDQDAICNHHTVVDVLEKFWTVEEVAAPEYTVKEHELCVDHFRSTHKLEDGRFVVRLPFNEDKKNQLGKSFNSAYKQFLSLERKLESNPKAREATIDFMRKYEDLGHMSVVPDNEIDKFAIYLPHHAVIKETSTTTKHRQVFNGSAPTSTGVSLNDALIVGPTTQADLIDRLINFRCLPIAFTGDISMMYRQILVAPEDRDFQRILWRESKDLPLKHYRLNTVTYGTASAPFLAIECLRELGRRNNQRYPVGSSEILRNFYVDDLVTGAWTAEAAIEAYEQVTALVKEGGFTLMKFASNSEEVLRHIPNQLKEVSPTVNFEDSSTRTLGIKWHHKADQLSFDIALKNPAGGKEGWTKRAMASAIASVFDPLGLLSPVIIRLKIFLQQLWLEKLSWDDQVPEVIAAAFQEVYDNFTALSTLVIPRCVISSIGEVPEVDIHGFCDASGRAYGACIYVVSRNEVGRQSRLLISKTKVSPLKKLTIPRLELCAAVLLAKLFKKVNPLLVFQVNKVYAWSDNTTVLHWLHQDLHRLQTFVCNRVSSVIEVLPAANWRHVRTEWNPADCASRGILPSELPSHPLWWCGPEWLLSEEVDAEVPLPDVQEDDAEFWKEVHHVNLTEVANPAPLVNKKIIETCSSYWRMIRVRALFTRFAKAKSFLKVDIKKPYTMEEVNAARDSLIRTVQQDEYQLDIAALEAGDNVKDHMLRKLSPFVCSVESTVGEGTRPADGLLRVGGRLSHSDLSSSKKYPVILPSSHKFTRALVSYYHFKTMHGGPTLLRSLLGQQFWIVGARKLCRNVVNHCLTCLKAKAEAADQYMADLPPSRVTEARPFTHTGVDFGGTFLVKDRNGRGVRTSKGYVCLFVCFSTKAVHLEFVSDLTTAGFIGALHRFVATRGCPARIQSDGGTNFVGAANEFAELLKDPEVASTMLQEGIEWIRNVPGAPHHGGLWEAGIKQAKKHIKRTFGGYPLTFEEWTTAVKRVEAILNSRPLTPLSSDPEDLSALTPAHFLVGSPLVGLPEYDLSDVAQNRLSSWQKVQQRSQIFWRRWKDEYLSTLQQRPKWWAKKEFTVGAFVLIKEPTAMLKWSLGIIEAVYPGPDGLVRSVRVRVNGQTAYDRPVTKICLLPWDGMLPQEEVKPEDPLQPDQVPEDASQDN